MCVFTHSCVWGRGRQTAREQRFEVQGWDTCEQVPPRYSSPSHQSYVLQRHGDKGGEVVRRWRVRRDERQEIRWKAEICWVNRKKEEKETQAGRRVWRTMWRGWGMMGEEKHLRGILLDQYNSTAISMVNSLCCIQFALFPAPQIHFTASANRAHWCS